MTQKRPICIDQYDTTSPTTLYCLYNTPFFSCCFPDKSFDNS